MRTFFSRLIVFFLILLIVCGLFIALLPTLASTSWGNRQVVNWINRSIPGNVEIRSLELHWGKGQRLEGILLKDPEGQSVLGIEKFSTEATLWQLLSKSTHLGITEIQDLNAAIVTDEKGWTNLQRAVGIPPSNDTPPLAPSTIVLSDVNAHLELFTSRNPFFVHIKGLTKQENLNGSFDLHVSLEELQGSDWEKLKQDAQNYLNVDGSKEAKIQAKIVNFPVDLIDRLVALKNPQLNGFFHSILGDRVNLTIDQESSTEGLAFNLTALTPLMQGDVKGKMANGVLILQEPAIFHFNLTPEFVNPFTHYQVEFLRPSRLKVIFPNLSFPLNFLDSEASVDFCLLGFNAEVSLPETEIDVYPVGKMTIRSLQAHLDSPPCDKIIQLKVVGEAQQGKESFDIRFDSNLNKPKNLSYLLQQLRQSLQSSVTISHLPLELIPSLHKHPEWIEQIGPYADAQLSLMPKGRDEWEATLSFQTPHLGLKEAQFHIGKEVDLKSPAQLNWTGDVDCLKVLFKNEALLLDKPCSLQFTIRQFHLPLENLQFSKFQLESQIPRLQFTNLAVWGKVHVQDLFLKVDGQNLNQISSQVKGQLALLNAAGSISPLLKEALKFNQTSNWKIGSNGEIEMPFGQFQLNNSLTHVHIEGHLNSNFQLELSQPADIQYTLTPTALQTLSQLLAKEWPKLQENANLHLLINPTSFDLHTFQLASLHLQGLLSLNHVVLQEASGLLASLEDVVMPWVIDGRSNHVDVHLKGLAYTQKNAKPSQISAQLQFWPDFGHFELSRTKTEIQMNFAGMPTSILNMVLTTHDFSPVIGPIIDLNFKTFYDPSKEKPGYWDLKLDSSQFHIDGRFKLEDAITLLDANKPATVRLTVTPESYHYLNKIFQLADERKLASPFIVSGYLSQFYLPLKESLLDRAQFDFQLSATDIQWQDKAIPTAHLEGHLSSKNVLDAIQLSLEVGSASQMLTLKGALTNLFDQKRQMRNWQEMSLTADLDGQRLTPPFFQSLLLLNLDQTQKLAALLGESFEIKANCQLKNLNGPVQVFLKGTNGEIHLDGQVTQGILKLNQPLEGSVKMTPLLAQAFLAKNVPILSTAIGSEKPMTFRIEADQFYLPLVPFKLGQAKIGKGTLDLGKVRFRNEGELSSLLGLIRTISDPYLTIWFTPLYFQLDHGVLTLKRIDLLIANLYTLASWGNIHLENHRADLIIGLSAQSLYYAFGIQGLDEQYLLQVPLNSSNGKISIDKKKATARISSLVAQSQGGSAVKLLGNLLDLALSDNGEIAPAPTAHPFPWSQEFNSQVPSVSKEIASDPLSSDPTPDTIEGKKKKKHKHRQELDANQAIKGLQEGAIQILDHLIEQ